MTHMSTMLLIYATLMMSHVSVPTLALTTDTYKDPDSDEDERRGMGVDHDTNMNSFHNIEQNHNDISEDNNDNMDDSDSNSGTGRGFGVVDEFDTRSDTSNGNTNSNNSNSSNNSAGISATAWGSAPSTQTFQSNVNSNTNANAPGVANGKGKIMDITGGTIVGGSEGSAESLPHHSPPEGLSISAHVVVSVEDGLSYFAPKPSPVIPFTDCGPIMGSLTEQILLRQMKFRHFPAMAETSWGTLSDTEAQLVVCLHPLEVIVSGNNQESQTFEAGDVILFEDQIGKGHKLRAPIGANHRDKSFEDQTVSVLTFSLPNYKPSSSVLGFNKGTHDCSQKLNVGAMLNENQHTSMPTYQLPEQKAAFLGVPVRKIILSTLSLGLSSVFTLKITQFVPAKLSVRFGQLCMIGAGASASALLYDHLLEESIVKVKSLVQGNKDKYFTSSETDVSESIDINLGATMASAIMDDQ